MFNDKKPSRPSNILRNILESIWLKPGANDCETTKWLTHLRPLTSLVPYGLANHQPYLCGNVLKLQICCCNLESLPNNQNYRKLQAIWKLKVKNLQILNHILYVILHERTRNSTISLRALSMLKNPASAVGLRKLPPCSGDRAGNGPAVGRKFGYQLMYLRP